MRGYKAFYKDHKNRYGKEFKEGQIYRVDGPLQFGNNGNGIHFCKRLEDTLRYVPAMEEEVGIAEVTSLEDLVESNDEYYGYYDMYAARSLRIDRFLEREEITDMFLFLPPYRVERFVKSFLLTEKEIELYKLKYIEDDTILKAIQYYQEHDKEAYSRGIQLVKGKIYDRIS